MANNVVKFPSSTKNHLELTRRLVRWDGCDPVLSLAIRELARREGRPLAYIGRKLMLRGLIAYRRDGILGALITVILATT